MKYKTYISEKPMWSNIKRTLRVWLDSVIANLSNWLLVFLTLFNVILFGNFFGRPNLIVSTGSVIYISQGLGYISFVHTIGIKNEGRKHGYVTKIEGYIRSKDRDQQAFRKKITAQAYYPEDASFLAISISPNEFFLRDFELAKTPDRYTRDSANLIKALQLDEAQNAEKSSFLGGFRSAYASDSIAAMIEGFIKKRSEELKVGEYEYILTLTQDGESKPFFSKCYSFVITPENIFQFKETTKDFKRINIFLNTLLRPNLQIPVTVIETPEIKLSLQKALKESTD